MDCYKKTVVLLACTILYSVTTFTLLAVSVEGEAFVHPRKDYLDQLIYRARQQLLWENPYWHKLLHYRSPWFSSESYSQADGPGFFTDPEGNRNPQKELISTLSEFFKPQNINSNKQHSQCAFPARYFWLKKKLEIDPSQLIEQPCVEYDVWKKSVFPERISLVFASYRLGNPASMFGHTFLRFHQEGKDEEDLSLNYSAHIPDDDSFGSYLLKGIFGLYWGRIDISPYKYSSHKFTHNENRDLWEFSLNLRRDEIEQIIRHLWEMKNTFFWYYFFDENCSDQILSFLEIASEKIHFPTNKKLWTLPADTIRSLRSIPGLIQKVTYHPSELEKINVLLRELNHSERSFLAEILQDSEFIEDETFLDLPQINREGILGIALRILALKMEKDLEMDPRKERDLFKLINAGATKNVLLDRSSPQLEREPPDQAHSPSRISLGAGDFQGIPFLQLSLRPALHDLISLDRGYVPYSQLSLFSFTLRSYAKSGETHLERFDLLNIRSLVPINQFNQQLSWGVDLGWQKKHSTQCWNCEEITIKGDIGVSFENQNIGGIFFFLAGPEVRIKTGTSHRILYGLSGQIGGIVDFTPKWRGYLSESATIRGWNQKPEERKLHFQNRYSLEKDLEVYLNAAREETSLELSLAVGYFF